MDKLRLGKKRLAAAMSLWPWLAASACSMPTYHKWAYEVASNCDGNLKVIVNHDTDPREDSAEIAERSLNTADAAKIAGLRTVEKYLEVTFTSGAWCRFFLSDEEGECYTTPEGQTRAACRATRKKIEELPPSHDDGYR